MKVSFILALSFVSATAFADLTEEASLHKASKRPFVSKIIGGLVGAPGGIANGISNFLARTEFDEKDGFKKSKYVYQCSAPLPATSDKFPLNDLTQMYHTWLEVGADSYGMPFTQDETYFGGNAVISSPDPFLPLTNASKTCEPIHQPVSEDDYKYAEKFKCVAEKFSVKNNILDDVLFQGNSSVVKTIYFQYNALTNNCLSAVKFVTECAGGRISQNPNLGVGADIEEENLMVQLYSVANLVHLKRIKSDFKSIDNLMPELNIKNLRDGSFKCKNNCDLLKREMKFTFERIREHVSLVQNEKFIEFSKTLTEMLDDLDNEEDLSRLKLMVDVAKSSLFFSNRRDALEVSKVKMCNDIRRSCGF